VVNVLERNNAFSIAVVQEISNYSNGLKVLRTDLACMHANFVFLLQPVIKLEKTTDFLSDKLNKINSS
jgi:hypothetical protein